MTTTAGILAAVDACGESVDWAAAYPDPSDAWGHCPRGDWLLWAAVELGVAHKLVVLAACDCARTALRYVPGGEDRPLLAIETAEAWCRGEATEKEAREAATDCSIDSSYAASYAADAAGLAADAACAAADAPWVATYAVAAADAAACASYATHCAARQKCADLVRARIPWAAVEPALALKWMVCT
jgi:hypothetical protein